MDYKYKSLNLNLFSHRGWSQKQALKELLVNSIDEHEELGIPLSDIKLICYKNCFVIKDKGRGIKFENFCQGNSTKQDKDLRGYHGQGLRGSVSRLLLEGNNIYIKTPEIMGKFIVKKQDRIIKIMYIREKENSRKGTEIQIFFDEKNESKMKEDLCEICKDIVYFDGSHRKKIEEIKCKDGTEIDVYIPNKENGVYQGGFFYKGIKIGIGKTVTDFGFMYNVKYSDYLEKKIRGESNFNRIIDVGDTYKIIEHTFKDPNVLNIKTVNFFENEIKEKYITDGSRLVPKNKGQPKYRDLVRKPILKIFNSGKEVVTENLFDYDTISINYIDKIFCDNFFDGNTIFSSCKSVKISKDNYIPNKECEIIFNKLKSEGFTIEFSE